VCVCVRERESKRERKRDRERQREREREREEKLIKVVIEILAQMTFSPWCHFSADSTKFSFKNIFLDLFTKFSFKS